MEMDRFSERVRTSIAEAHAVGRGFERILDQVQSLTPRLESVDEGMQSQALGAQSINDAMAQLAEVAQALVPVLLVVGIALEHQLGRPEVLFDGDDFHGGPLRQAARRGGVPGARILR